MCHACLNSGADIPDTQRCRADNSRHAVSEGMRSLGTSVYLLTVAVGTYLASALNIIVAAASPHDLWVSDNPLFGHYDW